MTSGPRSKRLQSVSVPGPAPTIEITEEQFERLETIYGVGKFSADGRKKISALANEYLHDYAGELISGSRSELQDILKKAVDGLGPFFEFTTERLIPPTSAGQQFIDMMETHYAQCPIDVHPRHFSILHPDGAHEPANLSGRIVVELDNAVLMQVGLSLQRALRKAGTQLEMERNHLGISPGTAFRRWLSGMRTWAEGRSFVRMGKTEPEPYPVAAFKNDSKPAGVDEKPGEKQEASTFSRFLFELNSPFKTVPVPPLVAKKITALNRPLPREQDGLSNSVNSAQALATQLKDVTRRRAG